MTDVELMQDLAENKAALEQFQAAERKGARDLEIAKVVRAHLAFKVKSLEMMAKRAGLPAQADAKVPE